MAGVLGDEIDVLAKARRAMPGDYVPSDDEPYMSEPQLDYFRRLLLEWKKSILSASAGTLSALQDGPLREPDLNDRASSVVVAVPGGTHENTAARLVRDAIRAHFGKDVYKVETDDGEDVLVKKRGKTPDFEIVVVRNTAEGLRISLDRE